MPETESSSFANSDEPVSASTASDGVEGAGDRSGSRRRRGSRGGKNRKKSSTSSGAQSGQSGQSGQSSQSGQPIGAEESNPELPDLPWEGTVLPPESKRTSRPSKEAVVPAETMEPNGLAKPAKPASRSNRSKAQPRPGALVEAVVGEVDDAQKESRPQQQRTPRKRPRANGDESSETVEHGETRKGRERNGRPVGRYLMSVHVRPNATQIAVLEGRSLVEHYVSQSSDDSTQIHGNIYLGRVQNVLPGMEAAFVDIATPKNAVLYRSDVAFDAGDIDTGQAKPKDKDARIEQLLRNGQLVVCQITKNPIGQKGARLTQEVSLPGRFVVLVPNSATYGISKRLPDDERKRLRRILDEVRPQQHGIIVRTAAAGTSADELRRDVALLVATWEKIEAKARKSRGPVLLHREPDLAVRIIREEFNADYRGVVIDNREVFEEVRSYVESISPELADRVEFHDPDEQPLPIFERHHVHEQLHKAIDRKVWLPSGGSLIIERTEALTVIDVNTGKNVGSTSLEETVYRNNLEAAQEIARQLRLRDIGGIIVIDFIDMEIRANRTAVVSSFREALTRDKTRTQVFEISDLGLVEMTRKRISEGLVEALSDTCPTCNGRGFVFDPDILDE